MYSTSMKWTYMERHYFTRNGEWFILHYVIFIYFCRSILFTLRQITFLVFSPSLSLSLPLSLILSLSLCLSLSFSRSICPYPSLSVSLSLSLSHYLSLSLSFFLTLSFSLSLSLGISNSPYFSPLFSPILLSLFHVILVDCLYKMIKEGASNDSIDATDVNALECTYALYLCITFSSTI